MDLNKYHTFAGNFSLWGAIIAVADVGAMLVVTLNGLRLLPYNSKSKVKVKMNEYESEGKKESTL